MVQTTRFVLILSIFSLVRCNLSPQNFSAFECAVNSFALSYASTKLPSSAVKSLRDALNIDQLCNSSDLASIADEALLPFRLQLEQERLIHTTARETLALSLSQPGAVATFYVSTTGLDTNTGTIDSPFATLPRAALAARTIPNRIPGDVTVFVRAGIYYMGSTGALVLNENDSNVTWSAYPLDAPSPVILSGAIKLENLLWKNSSIGSVPGILVTSVTNLPPDERVLSWKAAHPGQPKRAGPPPLVASLFVNGVRQVRARYPNGNPQDTSGICFSAQQRPGEGCKGYTSCVTGQTGSQYAPAGVRIDNCGPNRGQSPVWGCSQCSEYGTFGYTIYPPPPDHPVYNKPLPGVGWSNTSVFSFWSSPFDRPAGVVVNTGCNENNNHWLRVNYSNPTGAIVHMFHSGLWGGWQFAVDNITVPQSDKLASFSSTSLPSDVSLWFDASLITGVGNGQSLSRWLDQSLNKNDATQTISTKQPIYVSNSKNGGLPAVRFSGKEVLLGGGSLPDSTTMLAVVTDTGSLSTYCTGVFTSLGGLNSLCTERATAQSPAPTDDDPPTPGSSIIATALDWAGSPSISGHRDLLNKPTVLTSIYTPENSESLIDGCVELIQNPGQGTSGQGFMIGSRNDEMGRYFIGDISEVIIYSRVLNSSELDQAISYLTTKYSITSPKHCASPPPPPKDIHINFGFGGYQEARGSGVNSGQHMYIENVFEELDVGGEFFFDSSQSLLYVLPNMSISQLEAATLAIPVLYSVITVNGSQLTQGSNSYASSISFNGFTITQTRVTYLEIFEPVSGGDWTVHRGASLFVQDAENITIASCRFDQVGGNGIIFSNHIIGSTIADNEIVYSGDSAIVSIGSTNGIDGSAPTYPNGNLYIRNHAHETGVYTKQTSCYAHQLSANATFIDNVCYSGPRANINVNDGFGGGNLLKGNVLFNAVRETGDHGPYNSCEHYMSEDPMFGGFISLSLSN